MRHIFATLLFVALTAPGSASQIMPPEIQMRREERRMEMQLAKIEELYGTDTKFIEAFRGSQKAWESYRDAVLEAFFPEEDKKLGYGSQFPTSYSIQKLRITKIRNAEIKQWIDGIEEGETAYGSVLTKEEIEKRANKTVVTTPAIVPR